MNKYIHLRQVVAYYILICCMVVTLSLCKSSGMIFGIFSYFVVFSGIILIPSIKRELGYKDIYQTFLYYFPMYVWIVYIVINYKLFYVENNLFVYITVIFACVVLILLRYKDISKILNGSYSKVPIEKNKFVESIINFIFSILSEEIYFTAILISSFSELGLVRAVSISTILFVLSHYLNRWAKTSFSFKDYLFILLLAVIKGIAFWYTKSLLICIIMHTLYNSSNLIVLFKKYKNKQDINEISFFNDY